MSTRYGPGHAVPINLRTPVITPLHENFSGDMQDDSLWSRNTSRAQHWPKPYKEDAKGEESFGKALDLALGVLRTTPPTRLIMSAFELYFGKQPNTEWGNRIKLDTQKDAIKIYFCSEIRNLACLHIQWKRR